MSEDPSHEHDDVVLVQRMRARPVGVVIGCFLLGGAAAALYAVRAQELLEPPPELPQPGGDIHFMELRIPDDDGEDAADQRHAGEEGKMGRPHAKSGAYALKGPRDAIPQLARSFEAAPDRLAIEDAVTELPTRGAIVQDETDDAPAEQAFTPITDDARSTFSIDVDTASYSYVRRYLGRRMQPPTSVVRIEELINYFDYDYPEPGGDAPFAVVAEVGPCPWNPAHKLVHLGLQGRRLAPDTTPPRNLVFLVDVSGSMDSPDKLPLLQQSLGLLVDRLRPEDRVGIVVYAGASGIVLDSTPGNRRARIRDALDRLRSGGGTNGGAGIELAYRVAEAGFVEGGINRVVLATDGDFNVGLDSEAELHQLIAAKRDTGVFLSVLGFGTGNVDDGTMELLADRGNGNYGYIDTLAEAKKLLVDDVGGTLITIAKDVKIQVELDPAEVASWRLVGYDNRRLQHADFTDDTKDAGEIGAGHSVTALYEIVPATGASGGELMHVALRYKRPDGDHSALLEQVVHDRDVALDDTSDDFRFAAAVAEAGLLLRHSEHAPEASWTRSLVLAEGARGRDRGCLRAQFVALVGEAARLAGTHVPPSTTACSP